MATLQNNMVFQFTGTMLTSDTEVGITNDLERNLEVNFTDAYIEVKNRKGNKVERMKASATGGTFTASKRGLDQSDSDVEVPELKLQWNEGSIAYVTILSSQLVDRQASNTFVGDQTFEGNVIMGTTNTTKYGVKLKALTTTQRNALSSPPDGTIILNTTTGAIEAKVGGSFQGLGAGATTPNASDTVTGKVRLSDQTQTEEQTTTEGGDPLIPTNVTINPNNITSATPAVGDKLAFSDVSDSHKLRSTTVQTLVDTARPLATNAEASTGAGTTQSITPLQLKKYFGPQPSAGTTYTASSASGTLGSTSGTTYLKAREGTIARAGTYTVQFTLNAGLSTTGYGRIYKNGVAFGTEQTVFQSTSSPSENLTFAEGDVISLWYKSSGGGSCTVSYLTIKYSLVDQNAFTLS